MGFFVKIYIRNFNFQKTSEFFQFCLKIDLIYRVIIIIFF
jgi:hypothetical protein